MRKNIPIFLFLFLLPAVTLTLATAWRYSSQFQDPEYFPGYVAIITAFAAGLSIFSLGLILYIAALWTRIESMKSQRGGLQTPLTGQTHDLTRRLAQKSEEVELLAAMREISLFASSHVEIEKVLDGSLAVIEGILKTREITVYMPGETGSDDKGNVVPKAQRLKGKTHFGGDIPPDVALETIRKAIRSRRMITERTDSEVAVSLPIVVDEELLGAVRLFVHESELPDGGVTTLEKRTESLINHIGLAIKTPTLYDRAVIDGLTGLFNRRHFSSQLGKYFGACRRLGQTLGLVLIDIDHFKKVNDTYGHISGDKVLRGVASVMNATVREYDTCYRYGGEELAILLPGATLTDALVVAERVRDGVETRETKGEPGENISVTVSAGVATFVPGMTDSAELIATADAGLYSAKEGGRNRVITIQEEAPREAVV
ncbi:MAG: GGDEF domain-containing protein [Planctomycetota bacterium]|jgi:diguanylate cyclase (GGDEF)-like protein